MIYRLIFEHPYLATCHTGSFHIHESFRILSSELTIHNLAKKPTESTSRDSMHAYISPHGVVDRWDAIVSTRAAVCRVGSMGRDMTAHLGLSARVYFALEVF